MRNMRSTVVVPALLLLLALPRLGEAQTEWGLNLGSAVATGWPTSRVSTTRLSILELEATRPLKTTNSWRMEYPLGVTLHARLANTALGPAIPVPRYPRGFWGVPTAAGRATATGMGVRPLALRGLRRFGDVELGLEGGVGAIMFNIPAPASNATRFNLTAELGVHARILVPGARVNFTYRIHHLSNAGFGQVNPAVDSHLLLFGISLR